MRLVDAAREGPYEDHWPNAYKEKEPLVTDGQALLPSEGGFGHFRTVEARPVTRVVAGTITSNSPTGDLAK